MTQEEWRPIPGYEDLYSVSDLGGVRSHHTRNRPRSPDGRLSPGLTRDGYPTVALHRQGTPVMRLVHRLVALAFLGPCPPGYEVRHLNGDPADSRLVNLAYGTRSDNMRDAVRHGTNHNASKTHCSRNHPFTEANTGRTRRRPTVRYCRACLRENYRRRRAAGLPK